MNVRRVVMVSVVWLLRWLLDVVLVFVQFAGAALAGIGLTRIMQAAKGIIISPSVVPDQALFYAGAVALMLATYVRWELRK